MVSLCTYIMNCPLLIGIFFSFVAILPQSTTALKCFKCKSEEDCASNFDFRSDFENKREQYIEECTSSSNYIPACKYIINKDYAVRERGCGGVGVTSRESFCTNRYKDVLICYCTEEWCNGSEPSGTAVNVAKEHFRRQEEEEESENKGKSAAVKDSFPAFWLAFMLVFNSICR